MKLVLCNPEHRGLAGLSGNAQQRHPPLSLAAIAGLTPPDWEVVIEDELWAPAKFHPDADLVGVTGFSSAAPRAYEMLAPYRAVGIPTIMGGIHATACEMESRKYAGSVIIGEAEDMWWQVLTHAKCGLFPSYRAEERPTVFAAPRYDLLDPRYEFGIVQFSRGCPHNCTFCSVPYFSGRVMRRQCFADVYRDLTAVPQEKLFIADDNLYGSNEADHRQATRLLAMIASENLGKKFVCQASMDAARDDEFLEAAQAAGIRLILIGIEAADTETLKAIGKRVNLKAGTLDFSRVHKHGIGVLGAWVFGFDTDSPETMLERARMMVESGSDCSQMSIATPLPGTPLYKQLDQDGRLLFTDYPADWGRYDFGQLVYAPKGFRCIEECYDSLLPCVDIAYNDRVVKDMATRTYSTTGDMETTAWAWQANMNYAAMAHLRADYWASARAQCV